METLFFKLLNTGPDITSQQPEEQLDLYKGRSGKGCGLKPSQPQKRIHQWIRKHDNTCDVCVTWRLGSTVARCKAQNV